MGRKSCMKVSDDALLEVVAKPIVFAVGLLDVEKRAVMEEQDVVFEFLDGRLANTTEVVFEHFPERIDVEVQISEKGVVLAHSGIRDNIAVVQPGDRQICFEIGAITLGYS